MDGARSFQNNSAGRCRFPLPALRIDAPALPKHCEAAANEQITEGKLLEKGLRMKGVDMIFTC